MKQSQIAPILHVWFCITILCRTSCIIMCTRLVMCNCQSTKCLVHTNISHVPLRYQYVNQIYLYLPIMLMHKHGRVKKTKIND